MQPQKIAGGIAVALLAIAMLLLAKKAMRKPQPPLVIPTYPEPPAPPELLPQPRVEPEPEFKPLEIRPDPVVGYAATPELVVFDMLSAADLKRSDVLYDLGSGDGRIVIMAAKRFGARAIGYEHDPALVKKSRESIVKQKLEKVAAIEQRNIYTLDLTRATVVTLYLSAEANLRLVPQLEKMRPGSRIVSHEYPIEGYKPALTRKVAVSDGTANHDHTIWVYTIPLQKE